MSEYAKSVSKQILGRSSTTDGANDSYDHVINLVDATRTNGDSSTSLTQAEQSAGQQLARSTTHSSVKDQLAQRKYAKWRRERFDKANGHGASAEEVGTDAEHTKQPSEQRGRKVEHAEHSDSAAVDFAPPPGSPEATGKESNQKAKHKHRKHKEAPEESAIDILYENQRGSFFCGIPLYSHSSLLNFDPSPWVTQDFKPSPVNITNAQVPDPSWQWSWKHWYVDMSEDVDEDGWQYSFAFFGKFSWHGTHPWFHSFCRRRRWLRKRVQVAQHKPGKPHPSSMSAAHQLNTDYFTIHPKRDRSPSLLEGGPKTAVPESFISYRTDATADDAPEEIDDIPSLLKALRLATIDREKLDVIRQFVEKGGEELAYLKERIPEIMHFLVFQNSKRQLLEFLKQKAQEAQQHRDEHDAEDRPEGEAESRRIDNLLKAVEAADEQIQGLEYWSDRKHIMETTEHTTSLTEKPLVTIFDKASDDPQQIDDSPAGEIKGIADKADVGTERVRENTYRGAVLAPMQKKDDKGKGKMKEKSESKGDNAEDGDGAEEEVDNDIEHDLTQLDFSTTIDDN